MLWGYDEKPWFSDEREGQQENICTSVTQKASACYNPPTSLSTQGITTPSGKNNNNNKLLMPNFYQFFSI
jgi:hypothetical protein